MAERPRGLVHPRRVGPADVDLLVAMFAALPEGDRTFLPGPLDRDAVGRWPLETAGSHWVVGTAESAYGYLGITPQAGWSSHVGEVRLIVSADHRRSGIGRALAHHGLLQGVALGLSKLTVAVAADKQGDIAMFSAIGFHAEALLEDHIRDRSGELHDLVLLSHDVSQVNDDLSVVGIDDAVGLGSAT